MTKEERANLVEAAIILAEMTNAFYSKLDKNISHETAIEITVGFMRTLLNKDSDNPKQNIFFKGLN